MVVLYSFVSAGCREQAGFRGFEPSLARDRERYYRPPGEPFVI